MGSIADIKTHFFKKRYLHIYHICNMWVRDYTEDIPYGTTEFVHCTASHVKLPPPLPNLATDLGVFSMTQHIAAPVD